MVVNGHVDRGDTSDIVFMDSQQDFDTDLHQKALGELSSQGIRRQIRLWIANCLQKRKQRFGIHRHYVHSGRRTCKDLLWDWCFSICS